MASVPEEEVQAVAMENNEAEPKRAAMEGPPWVPPDEHLPKMVTDILPVAGMFELTTVLTLPVAKLITRVKDEARGENLDGTVKTVPIATPVENPPKLPAEAALIITAVSLIQVVASPEVLVTRPRLLVQRCMPVAPTIVTVKAPVAGRFIPASEERCAADMVKTRVKLPTVLGPAMVMTRAPF